MQKTKESKILTIVICCYNSTKTILNTLASIDIEKNRDIDIFLIDDGSKDDLKTCVMDYLKKYPKQVHYFRKPNGNWGSCLNFAIKNAKSRYLSVLDSDDQYHTKAFNKVVSLLRKTRKETDIVFCNYEFHFLKPEKTKVQPITVTSTRKNIKYLPCKKIPLFHLITIHSTIFAVENLKTIRKLPEHVFYSDSLLIYRALLKARNVAYLNKDIYLYKYFIRPGNQSISIEKALQNFSHYELIYKLILEEPMNTSDKKKMQISRKFANLLLCWLMQILAKNYSLTLKQKKDALRKYTNKLLATELKNDCVGKLQNPLTKIIKNSPSLMLEATKLACNISRGGFVKATDYDKENKKWAKAIAKIRKRNQRKQARKTKKKHA